MKTIFYQCIAIAGICVLVCSCEGELVVVPRENKNLTEGQERDYLESVEQSIESAADERKLRMLAQVYLHTVEDEARLRAIKAMIRESSEARGFELDGIDLEEDGDN